MLYKVPTMGTMIVSGGDLRRVRETLGLTQQQFGELVGEVGKTIGNWERADHIPPKKLRSVRDAVAALRPELPEPPKPEPPDDVELLAAVAARFAWYVARISELEALLAGLSPDPGQIRLQGTQADKPVSSTTRAAWGRGPRQRAERDEDVPHNENH